MAKFVNGVKKFPTLLLKRLPIFLLKVLYILPFLLFGIWLLKLVYFPHEVPQVEAKKADESAQVTGEDGIFRKILLQKDIVPREHFHMVDEYVSRPETIHPTCLTCHGTYPHSKEQKVRSILNFHGGFIACSVCHAG
jgi:hypothetical protein